MKIVRPIPVTPERLIVSNVPVNDHPFWSATKAYAVGDRVVQGQRIFEALRAHSNVSPQAATDPPTWLDLGATNRWRMFDDGVASRTAQAGSVEVVIRPGAVVNAVALFGLAGVRVSVQMTDPLEGRVFARDISLVNAGVRNWYDYFFEPITRREDLVVLGMPAYGTAEVRVIVQGGPGLAAIGSLVLGSVRQIGETGYGSSVGITDYSRKERDAFGNPIIVQRGFSKRANFDVLIDTEQISTVQRLLASLRTQMVVWVGHEGFEETIVYGYYRDFDIVIRDPSVSPCTISVEGLV
ncbi:hypothetical protein FQZ97_414240 [compost metagenome]